MTSSIRFLLGHERRELRDVDPTMTVLEYLRTQERLCGTKEGCAEGDCGACTVVLGEPDGQGMRYRAVNACILFVPVLDGRQLITVEHLRDADGALHPVQQAMVEQHASQCGFCTPGFVMSLFALYQDEPQRPSRRRIDDSLAGNLCRCTGYRPIVDAAGAMYGDRREDVFRVQAPDTATRLREMRREDTLALEHGGRRYFAPVETDALARLLDAYPDATLLAGGTDVGLWVTKQHRDLDTVIHVGDVDGLHRIEETADGLEIGAAATHSEAYEALGRHFPDFGELMRRFASTQIRNSGTLGGNIANASPIGDSMPVLIALDARLVLSSVRGRRELPIDEFFLGYRRTALEPGEFLERVRIPLPEEDDEFRCYKISKRFDQDISAVCGAFRIRRRGGRVADVRIGFGGMAAVPARARRTEEALRGRPWNETAVAAAEQVLADEFTPLTDMRASESYRLLVAQRLLRKFFLETTEPGLPTRVLEAEEIEA